MRDGDEELRGRERAHERGVGVPEDDDGIRLLFQKRGLDRREQVAGLLAVRARARLQLVGRGWEVELRAVVGGRLNDDLVDEIERAHV